MLKRTITAILAIMLIAGMSQAADWKIDPAHSSVSFNVSHMVISKVPGNFKKFSGMIVAPMKDNGELDLSNAKVTMTVDPASIDTDNADRDKHLRSEDFFAVEEYSEWKFVSKRIIPGEGNEFKIVGDLTIKAVTKEVTFDAVLNGVVKDPWGNTKAGFSAITTINRQDFGVEWSKSLDAGGLVVGDDVKIMIELEAAKVEEE